MQIPLVTLHEELNTVEILKPIRMAKRQAYRKSVGLQKPGSTADVELRDSKAQLDVNSAIAGLEQAQKALAKQKIR